MFSCYDIIIVEREEVQGYENKHDNKGNQRISITDFKQKW